MKKRIILIALLASMTFGATACSVTQVDKNAEKTSATQAVETTQEKTTKETTTVEKTTVTTNNSIITIPFLQKLIFKIFSLS